jgi:predicted AAA+ superfamily ATPase
MSCLERAVDRVIDELLEAIGGVLIEGPRGCGKTSTGLHDATSALRLDSSPHLIELAALNPVALLEGTPPRLIDEWHLASTLWNHIRHEIDGAGGPMESDAALCAARIRTCRSNCSIPIWETVR